MTATATWLALAAGGAGASEAELDRAELGLGVRLPPDYRDVMQQVDGGDAAFGESWLVLWQARDLVERNEGYRVAEFAPGFTYFGSDGAGEAYAWDWRAERRAFYVVIPLVSPEPEVVIPCGDTFEAFLRTLFQGVRFERSR